MKIQKLLSSNDIGSNGAHQAGICVPKKGGYLDFFPNLNYEEMNPRVTITFFDDSNEKYKLNFIYYNNKFFGGTRNEFRLTGMTKFFERKNAKVHDKLILEKIDDNYYLKILKNSTTEKLVLSQTWKIFDL